MARQGRLYVPHATYFVVNRFDPRLDILAPSAGRPHAPQEMREIGASRRRFETLLNYLCRRWCARVHAYCWLPHSALFIVRIGEPPLECIMHTLRGSYSQYLRGSGRCTGPVHADRYGAALIDPDDYLLDVARHIFWSPVHAGLCKTPLGYEWSSVRTGFGEPDPAALCDTTIREALRQRGEHSRLGVERFLKGTPTPGFMPLLARGSRLDRRIVGSSAFVHETRRRAALQPIRPSRDVFVSWAARRLAIDPAQITDHPRRAPSVEGRAFVAWLATCSGAASLTEVAHWFKCDPSTLHRAIDHYSAARPALFNERVVTECTKALMSGGIEESGVPPEEGPRGQGHED